MIKLPLREQFHSFSFRSLFFLLYSHCKHQFMHFNSNGKSFKFTSRFFCVLFKIYDVSTFLYIQGKEFMFHSPHSLLKFVQNVCIKFYFFFFYIKYKYKMHVNCVRYEFKHKRFHVINPGKFFPHKFPKQRRKKKSKVSKKFLMF